MSRILLRRGNKADLPALNAGEPGFSLDTKKLYIGAAGGNAQVAMATQESYVSPTLLNSWVNLGAPYSSAGYMKDDLGFVHIRGAIRNGTVGAVAFTLPVGYRPLSTVIFPTVSNALFGYVSISSTGDVTVSAGSNINFVIDPICFPTF